MLTFGLMWPLGRHPRDRECFEYRTRRFVSLRIQVLCWSLTRNLLFGTKKARFAHALFIALRPSYGGCPSSNWRGAPRNASIAVGLELTYKSNEIIERTITASTIRNTKQQKNLLSSLKSRLLLRLLKYLHYLMNEIIDKRPYFIATNSWIIHRSVTKYIVFIFREKILALSYLLLFISFWDGRYVKFKPTYL